MTMEGSTVDRVSAAIWLKLASVEKDQPTPEELSEVARAAIEAMHTPTDAMKKVGATEIAHAHAWGNEASADVASDAFVAMIAAALDEADH